MTPPLSDNAAIVEGRFKLLGRAKRDLQPGIYVNALLGTPSPYTDIQQTSHVVTFDIKAGAWIAWDKTDGVIFTLS